MGTRKSFPHISNNNNKKNITNMKLNVIIIFLSLYKQVHELIEHKHEHE